MHLPNGSKIFVEKDRDEVKSATAISKAKEPVFTIESSGWEKNDIVIITESNWLELENMVLRVKNVSGNSVTMEGFDTTDPNVFIGTGTAKVQKITEWIEVPCVLDVGGEGGEQQFYNYQCLSSFVEQQLPTFKSARSVTYSFGHDYTQPIYPVLREADKTRAVKAMRMYVPLATETRLWSAVLSFDDVPKTAVNEAETVTLSAAVKGQYVFVSATAAG